MTIWCHACRRRGSVPCSSHYVTGDDQKNLRGVCSKRSRSTKGASKARRDHINGEIRSMRALLPIDQEEQERLSYLHSMAAICTYVRKTVLFQGFPAGQPSDCSLPHQAFLQALHGFILVTTAQGKLVCVSENVADYLGLSMVDVLQGDSIYDIVEQSDINTIKSNFEFGINASTERSFVCCMQTSKAFRLQHGSCCSILVRGSFHPSPSHLTEEALFVALCTPTVNRLQSTDSSHSFDSVHNPDMTFTHVSDSVFYLLGYSVEEMSGRSWYSLLHPKDLSTSASSHKSLIQAAEGSQVEMVLRLQHKDLSWSWVYTQATKVSDCQRISCTNFTISETEARFLIRKIDSNAFTPASQACSSPSPVQHVAQAEGSELTKVLKRQRNSSSRDEEPGAKIKRLSDNDMYYVSYTSSEDDVSLGTMGHYPAPFTPPYSPASSSSPMHNEESGSSFLMDGFSYTEQMPSSPEDSLSYYPQPEAGCPPHLSPSESLQTAAEQSFEAVHMTSAHSPSSCPSPTYNFQACTANARVVPDSLTGSDTRDSLVDCVLHPEEFTHLVQPQGGIFFQAHNIPHHLPSGLLTPNPSPTSQGSFQFDDLEQVEISILAQQISSLASSFDRYRALSPVHHTSQPATENRPSACDWPERPALSAVTYLKPELVLDDGVFDRILKELDVVTGKSDMPCPGVVSSSYMQGLVSGHNLTQHVLGQEPSGRLSSTSANPVNGEEFIPDNIAMAPFVLQLGSHDQTTGLYQLSHYVHRSLQQDGLEETY